MQPDEGFPESISSFQWPISVPTSDPDVGPFFYVGFNETWRAAVLGSLTQLLQQSTWDNTIPADNLTAQQQANQLIYLFQTGVTMFPTGSVIPYAATAAPSGWLPCDGAAVSRTTYADLFALIGSTFGAGDGSTTFNVPDLRGRTVIGTGTGSGLSPRSIGDKIGEETHVLTVGELASHSHTDSGHTHTEGNALPAVGAAIVGVPIPSAVPSVGVTGLGNASLLNSGLDGAHNTMQPSIALTAIIKT